MHLILSYLLQESSLMSPSIVSLSPAGSPLVPASFNSDTGVSSNMSLSSVGSPLVPASLISDTGVSSKDVVIDHFTGVFARLYLPHPANSVATLKKYTILVYYHGGGFTTESPCSVTYHNYLNTIAMKAGVFIISIGYRLAPVHPVPTAHLDARETMRWIVSHSAGDLEWVSEHGDPWLAEHGDFNRMFLAGDSAGANIAHLTTLCNDVKLEGLVLAHPFFWGKKPVGNEVTFRPLRMVWEILWKVAYPAMDGIDEPLINPIAEGAPSLKFLPCNKVFVFTSEKCWFKERAKAYYENLIQSGWSGEAKYWEAEGEGHVFHLVRPNCAKAREVMEMLVAFLKSP